MKKTVYTWKDLKEKGTHYIDVDYGENNTRINKKAIDINGLVVSNVHKIKVELAPVGSMITIQFLDGNDDIICSHVMKTRESFIMEQGLCDCPTYSFSEDIESNKRETKYFCIANITDHEDNIIAEDTCLVVEEIKGKNKSEYTETKIVMPHDIRNVVKEACEFKVVW